MKNLLNPLRNLLESNFVNADQNFNHSLNPLLELKKIYGTSYRVKHFCKFENKKGKLHLVSHLSYYFSEQEVLNTGQFTPLRENNYLKKLPTVIDQKKVISTRYLKIDHIIFLLVETEHDWEELSPKETSFYWLQQYLSSYTHYFKNEISDLAISSLNQLQIIIPRFQSEINALIIRCEDFSSLEVDFRYRELMLQTLENLLFYLEKYYFRYLVMTVNASRAYKQNLLSKQKGKIDYVIRRLYNFEFIRNPLQELIIDEIKLNYQRLNYLLKLSNSLFAEIYPIKEEISADQIFGILQANNFNSLFFVKYWHDLILKKCLSSKDYKSCVKFLQKEMNKAKKLGFVKDAWIPDQPTLKDTMTELLFEEITCQTRLENIRNTHHQLTDKLLINLSVSSIAYLAKIGLELNLFPNIGVMELMRKISRNVSSFRQKHISQGSLQSKCYKADRSVKNSIRGLLKRMLDHVEEEMA